jgi:hypothetical protein
MRVYSSREFSSPFGACLRVIDREEKRRHMIEGPGRKSNHVQVEQQTVLNRSNVSLMRASIRREAGKSDEKKERKMEV